MLLQQSMQTIHARVAGWLALSAAITLLATTPTRAQSGVRHTELPAAGPRTDQQQRVPEVGHLIQIPGPNPLLVPGAEGDWDGGIIEAGTVFKDQSTYYLYYHARPKDKAKWPRDGYRIGVATAPHPLGPWKKYPGNPIMDLGPEGHWDADHVACPTVLKEEASRYFMWYCAVCNKQYPLSNVGLAVADNPLGPWKRLGSEPAIKDFGYPGGVVRVNGQYRMYSAWPLGSTSPDQGAIYVATADRAEGPWTKHTRQPAVAAGGWGAWDDGGFSEANVLFHDGVFHVFYGGTKWEKIESIGYAYSFDGFKFIKYPGNPVALHENEPGASALAEAHTLWEAPFYYVYHTLRYEGTGTGKEHIGVQVLATRTPFSLTMPVLSLDRLRSERGSDLSDSSAISVGNVRRLSLTIECRYAQSAKQPIRLHVRASADGTHYDTVDATILEGPPPRGDPARKTLAVDTRFPFIKVLVENPDRENDIRDIAVTANLGS